MDSIVTTTTSLKENDSRQAAKLTLERQLRGYILRAGAGVICERTAGKCHFSFT